MCTAIDSVAESIQEANTKLVEFANNIRDLEWSYFDMVQDLQNNLVDETSFMIKLLSQNDLYTDNGQLTNSGMSTLGLYMQNYNSLMYMSDSIADEIESVSKQLADDPYNTTLQERIEELREKQWQLIESANDAKQSIKDLVDQGIQLEIDALNDLISTYTDALDSAKDLYDYQKNVQSASSDISSIQKQIISLQGDYSEENKSTLQKLGVQLTEAESKMQDLLFDRYVSSQKELLSNLSDEYSEVLGRVTDDLGSLLIVVSDAVNASAVEINETINTEAESVGYTLSTEMSSIWEEASAFQKEVREEQNQAFEDILTNLVNNGTISQENKDALIEALGNDDFNGKINAGNIISQLQNNGTLTTDLSTLLENIINGTDGTNARVYNVVSELQKNGGLAADTASQIIAGLTTEGGASGSNFANILEQLKSDGSLSSSAYNDIKNAIKDGGETKTAVTTYDSNFQAKATTTNDALASIKTLVQDMVNASNKTATSTTSSATTTASSSSSGSSSSSSSSSTTSSSSSGGNGKLEVGDKVKYNTGSYYNDSYGTTPTGNKNLGSTVTITKVVSSPKSGQNYPVHISTGSTLGSGDLGWVKSSQISGYKTGGIVDYTGLAAVHGSTSEPELVLNAKDTKNFIALKEALSQVASGSSPFSETAFANSIVSKLSESSTTAPTTSTSIGDISYTFNIPIDHVDDYNDFVNQLTKDNQFEKFVQSMTVDRLAGGSKLTKNKYKW